MNVISEAQRVGRSDPGQEVRGGIRARARKAPPREELAIGRSEGEARRPATRHGRGKQWGLIDARFVVSQCYPQVNHSVDSGPRYVPPEGRLLARATRSAALQPRSRANRRRHQGTRGVPRFQGLDCFLLLLQYFRAPIQFSL